MLRKQRELFLKTITILAQAVELRDDYTGGHTQRVTRYATMLAQKLELPEDQIELIRMGGPLHDIGKIGIDDAILRKPGRLTPDEFAQMQKAHDDGRGNPPDDPRDAADHPDRPQPPRALGRDRLPRSPGGRGHPLPARIVAVADAFDAMTSHRPYHENRKGRPPSWAFAEVERQASKQFDPECAAAFLAIREQIVRAMLDLMPGTEIEEPLLQGPDTVDPSIEDPSYADEYVPDPRN